ncbi:MAG: MotA/TolQ/ExbB proton channel family protein [Candidatus Omnitrophica bacterium]|nr:MotA/TolQ/ExbB proton channel family protein [Candidatus Omnitrophota bacterium]
MTPQTDLTFWAILKMGGPMMMPIALCAFFALAISFEKWLYFSSIAINSAALKQAVFDLVKTNRVREAIAACEASPAPLGQILKAGLERFGSSQTEMEIHIANAGGLAIPPLESKIVFLSTIAFVSPLLGLLGTVLGMMAVFHSIQVRTAALSPVTYADLAGGIGQALIATAAGLLVAIPAYLAFHYFQERVERNIVQMERGAAELVKFICQVMETKAS